MDNLSELAFGKDYVDREKRFGEGVDEIEKKYNTFFNNRESKLVEGEKDKLLNHIVTAYDGRKIRITLSNELPKNIKGEIEDLFRKVWGTE